MKVKTEKPCFIGCVRREAGDVFECAFNEHELPSYLKRVVMQQAMVETTEPNEESPMKRTTRK